MQNQHTTEPKLSLKHQSEENQPREKLLKYGKAHLSNAELLAILIGSGNNEDNAVQLCEKILASVEGNLTELGKKSVVYLKQFKGIGDAKALTFVAALELGRRRQKSDFIEHEQICTSRDIHEYIFKDLIDLQHEEFWVILLNRANHVIGKKKISSGGTTSTVADPKMIIKPALDVMASSIILIHNHPSGNLKPSEEDIKMTRKIKLACSHFDIQLHDHLIFSHTGYYSFADAEIL